MTIFIYIMAAVVSTLLVVGSVLVVFKAGEKELICKYDRTDGGKN